MKQLKKASLKWRLMLALAGMTANMVWGQGIIHVCPQPQPFYNAMTFLDALDMDLDINGDGVPDFTLHSTSVSLNSAWLIPLNGNLYVSANGWVADMALGDMVGPDMASQYGWEDSSSIISLMAELDSGQGVILGNFLNTDSDGYIGFDLVQGGNNYYGWMQVYSPVNALALYGIVTEWAYSTVPNVPIMVGQVPEPSTWALFGLGSLAFFALRQRWWGSGIKFSMWIS